MNEFEDKVKHYLEQRGYEVIRNGWPDFLCVNQHRGRGFLMCVEVKNYDDKLSAEQKRIHGLLQLAGIPVYVLRPDQLAEAKRSGKALMTPGECASHRRLIKELQWNIESLLGQARRHAEDLQRMEHELATVAVLFEKSAAEGVSSSSLTDVIDHAVDKTDPRDLKV